MTCLLALGVVVSLSLRNASQNLKKYGQLHRTGSIYGGNRANRMHQQQKQEQLHLMQEAQSQGQEIYKSIMNAPNVGLPIPSAYKHLAEVSDVDTSGIPFFWHLPRSGGSTVRDLLTDCYDLVMATGQGIVPNDLSITVSPIFEGSHFHLVSLLTHNFFPLVGSQSIGASLGRREWNCQIYQCGRLYQRRY